MYRPISVVVVVGGGKMGEWFLSCTREIVVQINECCSRRGEGMECFTVTVFPFSSAIGWWNCKRNDTMLLHSAGVNAYLRDNVVQ